MVARVRKKPEPRPTQDLDEARRFLDALDPAATVFTFQTFDDNPDQKLKDKKLAGHHTDTFDNCADWLTRVNRKHAGVFVTINSTDGCGRTKKNVTAVRALMLDLDGAPLDPVLVCPLKPHIVTETSAGNFHALWLVNGLPLDEFEGVQRGLAKRFDGDPAVATLERCTRLPGFIHSKDIENRFLTRIVETNDVPTYTAEQVMAEFPPEKASHKAAKSGVVLPAGVPVECAREFVHQRFFEHNTVCLHYYRGGFYEWRRTHYKQRESDYIRAELYLFLHHARVESAEGIAPFNPTAAKVSQILDALQAGCYLDSERETPCWLSSGEHGLPDRLIACRNGLLDPDSRVLMDHTPKFFNVNALTFDYLKDPQVPKRWHQFLRELWPDDEEAAQTLQEIFGLMLTADTSHQKIFMFVGPKRSGKGTIGHVLTALLGRANVANPTMASLGTQFGLWPLIDKRLAIVPIGMILS